MIALDTNLLVRLLTNDDARQAAKVEAWLSDNATPRSPAYVDHVVLCELAWVLERSYAYGRTHVHQALSALLEHGQMKLESPGLVRQALLHYADGPADFSDYLLAARTQVAGCSTVLTLDKKAAKAATHSLLR